MWELAEHRYVFIVEDPAHAGGANVLVWVDDLDERVASIASRGIDPVARETYANGARKVVYRDADGNELALGGT